MLHGSLTNDDTFVTSALVGVLAVVLDPGVWVFPTVFIVHGLRMVRGNWGEMGRWPALVCCALLALYALHDGLMSIDPD